MVTRAKRVSIPLQVISAKGRFAKSFLRLGFDCNEDCGFIVPYFCVMCPHKLLPSTEGLGWKGCSRCFLRLSIYPDVSWLPISPECVNKRGHLKLKKRTLRNHHFLWSRAHLEIPKLVSNYWTISWNPLHSFKGQVCSLIWALTPHRCCQLPRKWPIQV